MFNPHGLVEDSKSTVVLLLDPSLPSDASFDTVQWQDPHSGMERPYLIHQSLQQQEHNSETTAPCTIICEIQSFASDYASYLIPGGGTDEASSSSSSLVIGRRSDLWCVTPMDPLFFLLAQCCPAPITPGAVSHPWQPLDQLWAPLSNVNNNGNLSLEAILMQRQSQALAWYDCMEIDAETIVYKFVATKALAWLQRKQQTVEAVLAAQTAKSVAEANDTGAFSNQFTLPEDLVEPTATSHDKAIVVSPGSSQNCSDNEKDATTLRTVDPTARMESIQLICSYLNEAWRSALLHHLGESVESCLEPTKLGKKRRVTVDGVQGEENAAAATIAENVRATDWNHNMTTGGASGKAAPTKQAAKLTVQQKKLSKVNTKGMSKMTSFFTKKK